MDQLEILNIAGAAGITEKCFLIGIRGYQGKNTRGGYDDAAVLVGPGYFNCFNFNTDPTRNRPGHGTGGSKGIASLKPGLYRVHVRDIHGGSVPHRALCERKGPVTVLRDADSSVPEKSIVMLDGIRCYEDRGDFGINIHRGGENSTSSLGCQTIPPSQWKEFFTVAVEREMDETKQMIMPYYLFERK